VNNTAVRLSQGFSVPDPTSKVGPGNASCNQFTRQDTPRRERKLGREEWGGGVLATRSPSMRGWELGDPLCWLPLTLGSGSSNSATVKTGSCGQTRRWHSCLLLLLTIRRLTSLSNRCSDMAGHFQLTSENT
jgi:hypothetical protein